MLNAVTTIAEKIVLSALKPNTAKILQGFYLWINMIGQHSQLQTYSNYQNKVQYRNDALLF